MYADRGYGCKEDRYSILWNRNLEQGKSQLWLEVNDALLMPDSRTTRDISDILCLEETEATRKVQVFVPYVTVIRSFKYFLPLQ